MSDVLGWVLAAISVLAAIASIRNALEARRQTKIAEKAFWSGSMLCKNRAINGFVYAEPPASGDSK